MVNRKINYYHYCVSSLFYITKINQARTIWKYCHVDITVTWSKSGVILIVTRVDHNNNDYISILVCTHQEIIKMIIITIYSVCVCVCINQVMHILQDSTKHVSLLCRNFNTIVQVTGKHQLSEVGIHWSTY